MRELDLVVFPRYVDGERYVAQVVELLGEAEFHALDRDEDACGAIRKDGTTVYWNRVAERDHDARFRFDYDHPQLGDDERDLRVQVFDRLADANDRPVEAVESEFHRKHRYVEYLQRERYTDFEELFGFLADLRTDEAATVERVSRAVDEPAAPDGAETDHGGERSSGDD